jgi:cytochrome c oxidase cbb3-type subunit 2
VRPLKTEVMRYGEYSKAGEFTYDQPFLWGSKRTGPDLARIGGKYPDKWHQLHFENPQSMFAESNMPQYAFLNKNKLDSDDMENHMKAMSLPSTAQEIAALKDRTEMDALIAYMQVIGTAIKKAPAVPVQTGLKEMHMPNPLAGDKAAIAMGAKLFQQHCSMCHGDDAKGGIGPSLVDDIFFSVAGDLPDDDYFEVINNGVFPGMVEDGRTAKENMPGFAKELDKNKIWSLVAYLRSIKGK